MTNVQQPPPQQPWQPGPPPRQPYQPQPGPPQQTNGRAVAGFILALLGFFASASGSVLGFILCLAGVVLSIVGVAAARDRRAGRGLAIAGIVIACVGLISFVGHRANTNSSPTPAVSAPSYSSPSYSAPTYAAPSYAAPSTQTASPMVTGVYPAGTYTVGEDIQPGTYTTPGSSWCYWKRSRDASNESGSIIANDIVNGQGTMTVKASDKFVTFDGTCVWTRK